MKLAAKGIELERQDNNRDYKTTRIRLIYNLQIVVVGSIFEEKVLCLKIVGCYQLLFVVKVKLKHLL